jgi:hypothetical protein
MVKFQTCSAFAHFAAAWFTTCMSCRGEFPASGHNGCPGRGLDAAMRWRNRIRMRLSDVTGTTEKKGHVTPDFPLDRIRIRLCDVTGTTEKNGHVTPDFPLWSSHPKEKWRPKWRSQAPRQSHLHRPWRCEPNVILIPAILVWPDLGVARKK